MFLFFKIVSAFLSSNMKTLRQLPTLTPRQEKKKLWIEKEKDCMMSESFWHELFNISLTTRKRILKTALRLSSLARLTEETLCFILMRCRSEMQTEIKYFILFYVLFLITASPRPSIKYSCGECLDLIWFMELNKAQVTYQASVCEKRNKNLS